MVPHTIQTISTRHNRAVNDDGGDELLFSLPLGNAVLVTVSVVVLVAVLMFVLVTMSVAVFVTVLTSVTTLLTTC